jgi:2-methylcitrate dehydratase PrpD
VQDPRIRAFAEKIRYEIDANNPYPRNYTGHIRAVLRDGRVVEERQPHLRGGANEPLSSGDVEEKFMLNARYGGWSEKQAEAARAFARKLYDGKVALSPLRG